MEKWFIKSGQSDLSVLAKDINEKILYRIISNRGIETEEELGDFIEPDLSKLISIELMKDMDKALEICLEAIDMGDKIRIVGDYDVDGIMSSFILYKFLKNLSKNVDYLIPHRVKDGYGINTEMVEEAKADGVKLIITCDNGISAFDAIELAKKNDIKLIVLDHHEPKIDEESNMQVLPPADAIVDPKRQDCPYPFKGLCGGALAYKFISGLADTIGYEDGEIERDYLEFAAFATVCDVMDLVGENRIIVYNGLKFLNNTFNLGLKALIEVSGLLDKEIEPYHLGFVLGPMFNASGRLDSATLGLELLLAQDYKEALIIAKKLKELNTERSDLTEKGLEETIQEIETAKLYEDDIIVVYKPEIHESIAGIIAGRVKEKYNKPTIVLTQGEEYAKGSARSIDEYNIIEGISREKDLLISYGGHKMAAGLGLLESNIDLFRQEINKNSNLSEEDFIRKVYIDLGLPLEFINEELLGKLDIMAPFGNGNPKPLFGAKNVELYNIQIIGKNKNVLKMLVRDKDLYFEGIIFRNIDAFAQATEEIGLNLSQVIAHGSSIRADIIYQLNINEWRGRKTIQLNINNYRLKRGG